MKTISDIHKIKNQFDKYSKAVDELMDVHSKFIGIPRRKIMSKAKNKANRKEKESKVQPTNKPVVEKQQGKEIPVTNEIIKGMVQSLDAAGKGETALLQIDGHVFVVVHINKFNQIAKQPINLQQDEIQQVHIAFNQLMSPDTGFTDEQFALIDSWSFPFSEAIMKNFPIIGTINWRSFSDDDVPEDIDYETKEILLDAAYEFVQLNPWALEKSPHFKQLAESKKQVDEQKGFQKAHTSNESITDPFEVKLAHLKRCLGVAIGDDKSGLESILERFTAVKNQKDKKLVIAEFAAFLEDNPDAEVD